MLDLRLSKAVNLGGGVRLTGNFDLYNVLNGNQILGGNPASRCSAGDWPLNNRGEAGVESNHGGRGPIPRESRRLQRDQRRDHSGGQRQVRLQVAPTRGDAQHRGRFDSVGPHAPPQRLAGVLSWSSKRERSGHEHVIVSGSKRARWAGRPPGFSLSEITRIRDSLEEDFDAPSTVDVSRCDVPPILSST